MPINGSYICDEQGEPRPFLAKGSDPASPNKIEAVYLEIRPGGMTVTKRLPNQRPTVAADPLPPPSQAEVEDARKERARQTEQREREALRAEREAKSDFTASEATAETRGDDADTVEPGESEAPDATEAEPEPEQDEQEQAEAEARARAARTATAGGTGRTRRTARA